MRCSFCGKAGEEVARLIAGPSVCICNECVGLCVDILDEERPETPFREEGAGGRAILTAKESVLVRMPNGSVYAATPSTQWETLDHEGAAFEWCCAQYFAPFNRRCVVVCVRRPGGKSAIAETFAPNTKPAAEHARGIAARFAQAANELEPAMDDLRASEGWIAEEPVAFLHPDGRRETGRIAISVPVVVSAGEAQCRVAMDGLERSARISGASPLQALLLALQFLGRRLHDFRARGGRVVDQGGDDDVALEAIFGPLLADGSGP